MLTGPAEAGPGASPQTTATDTIFGHNWALWAGGWTRLYSHTPRIIHYTRYSLHYSYLKLLHLTFGFMTISLYVSLPDEGVVRLYRELGTAGVSNILRSLL